MQTYKILRIFKDMRYPKETIKTDLTLAEAQEHCEDPETCSDTCTSVEGQRLTNERGAWFDGFYRE